MRATSYMNADSLLEWLKVGTFAGEVDLIAAATKEHAKSPVEKSWAKLLRTCATLAKKVTDERLKFIDRKQLENVDRRQKRTKVLLYTTDQVRTTNGLTPGEPITMEYNDVLQFAELALLACRACPQGKYVKDCEYRKVMHRIGIPVGRENPRAGECEFMCENCLSIILPQGNDKQAAILKKQLHVVEAKRAGDALKDDRLML